MATIKHTTRLHLVVSKCSDNTYWHWGNAKVIHTCVKELLKSYILALRTDWVGYRGWFYRSDDPTNSIRALKDNSWSVNHVKCQSYQAKPSTRQSEVSIIFENRLHSTIKSEDTDILRRMRARPNEIKACSSRPTWKNCSYDCASLKCYTLLQHEDSSPDQHHCSDEANWRLGDLA